MVGRFQVMALLQAARANVLGYPLVRSFLLMATFLLFDKKKQVKDNESDCLRNA